MDTVIVILIVMMLGPAIGAVVGVSARPTPRALCVGFAFAAGVMIAVSFLDLIPESLLLVSPLVAAACFFIGFIVMFAIDQAIPHFHPIPDSDERASLKRTTATLIAGIALHNLPEGLAIGASLGMATDIGLVVAISIALHDIPETIAPVSASLALTGRRGRAFAVGFLITAVTFVGFAIGLPLASIMSDQVVAYTLAATAGIMIYISSDELLPAAYGFKMSHTATFALMTGVLFVILMRLAV